ncbi:MAG: cation diffusion facilitator family transporter [Lutibacter sp.]
MSHQHHHHQVSGKNLVITILLNVSITVAQIIGGFLSNSLALISDALHNFTDVISLIVSYLAYLLTVKKKQTLKQTFGYKRAEIIAAFINGSTLIVIAIFLAVEAISRFFNPHIIQGNMVIWLALLSIIANGLSVLLLKKDANHNLNMKSAYLHLFTDMLTSIAVLIGGLLIKYYQIYWVDSVLTLVIAAYLIYMSWSILISAIKILMLFVPNDINIHHIISEITKIDKIKNVHHVHIWQLNDHDYHFEAHVEFKSDIPLSEFDEICNQVENLLLNKFKIYHVTLQPEYSRTDNKEIIIQD